MKSGEALKSGLAEALEGYLTDASFEIQAAILGLSRDDIDAERILDIGSGRSNKFARKVRSLGNNAIFSVNPKLAFEGICRDEGIDTSVHSNSVAALAQGQLPFCDQSFTLITSVMGVPKYLKTEELPDFMNEIWRLLKPGGRGIFWPMSHIRTSSNAEVSIDSEAFAVECIDDEALSMLPEEFRSCKERLVIKKTIDTPNNITEIASLETSSQG